MSDLKSREERCNELEANLCPLTQTKWWPWCSALTRVLWLCVQITLDLKGTAMWFRTIFRWFWSLFDLLQLLLPPNISEYLKVFEVFPEQKKKAWFKKKNVQLTRTYCSKVSGVKVKQKHRFFLTTPANMRIRCNSTWVQIRWDFIFFINLVITWLCSKAEMLWNLPR